jgi:AAA ATPase-like protein
VDLVGRLRELRELEDLLERAAGGSGGLVVVTGPGGSGRTALADVLEALAGPGDARSASDHRRRAGWIAERLGMTVLLERLARPADEWTLGRDGDDWLLEAGGERARLRDGRGCTTCGRCWPRPGGTSPPWTWPPAGPARRSTRPPGPPTAAA